MVTNPIVAMCFIPCPSGGNNDAKMPACKGLWFWAGVKQRQHSGAEVYLTNGLGSLCLLLEFGIRSPFTFFPTHSKEKLHVVVIYLKYEDTETSRGVWETCLWNIWQHLLRVEERQRNQSVFNGICWMHLPWPTVFFFWEFLSCSFFPEN